MTTAEEATALHHARHLALNGVPLFVAHPARDPEGNWLPDGGHHASGYWLPKGWNQTAPDPAVVDAWRPGDALCAVMGHTVDLVDVDPHKNGDNSLDRLRRSGGMPTSYGQAATPSGGEHHFVSALGVRSIDGLLPGLDIKAGDEHGGGRGFAFIAPTVKLSKTTGVPVPYVWVVEPELDQLTVVGYDDTGERLAQLISSRNPARDYDGPNYDGPVYADLPPDEQRLAATYLESELQQWRDRFDEIVNWPDGQTDERGRGWEAITRDAAWAVARLAVTPWTPLAGEDAQQVFEDLLPEDVAANPKCQNKWTHHLLNKAAQQPIDEPWWQGFLAPTRTGSTVRTPDDLPDFPPMADDAYMSEWVVVKALNLDWCWAGRSLGWMNWDGRRWVRRDEEELRERVRNVIIDVCQQALARNMTQRQLTGYVAMRSNGRIGAICQLMRGVNLMDSGAFDQQPDLLNVANGIVDLRTGALLPHDKKYQLTKIAATKYVPKQRHDDWDQCLAAFEPEVAEWMRLRIGQAITGHISSDDIMPIGQGGGSNGKSTFISALRGALDEYVTFVPEKLLRAGINDHPTELMTLFGARLAVIDETPEAAQLNVQRMKSVVGTEWITARQIHKDNVTWRATHSLMVLTNYVPQVTETDDGTWRRMALVRFRKKFKDEGFRARVSKAGEAFREAVLAWVVRGAFDWYQNRRVLPPLPDVVRQDTDDWRMDCDMVLRFIHDHLVFDPRACIVSRDLLETLNEWLVDRKQKPWSDRLLAMRFSGHFKMVENNVTKHQHNGSPDNVSRPADAIGQLPTRPIVWSGVRWKKAPTG